MEKIGSKFIFGFVFLFLLSSINLTAQTTSLTYKVKGKLSYGINISFSDEGGNTNLLPSSYFNYSDIYFVLSPTADSPKDFFKESDAEEILSQITIDENGNKIVQSSQPRFLLNSQNKVDRIIISFSKNGFNQYNPFSFAVSGFFSEKISIGEKYFQSFEPQKSIYQRAQSKFGKADFLGAYTDYMKILGNASSNPEIKSFSFYNSVITTDIPATIEAFINAESNKFKTANDTFLSTKNIETLNACDEIAKSATSNIETFNTYLELEEVDVSTSKDMILSFLNDLTEQNTQNIETFEQEKMLFFKENSYQDYQFSLFVDLISKMLLYKNSLSFIDKLEPIDVSLLKNFSKSKKELMGNWEEQFYIHIGLINKNIEQSGVIFKNEVMENLMDLSANQKQPYFEIISAFNSLNNDQEEFKRYLQQAMTKSSDETILEYIECWLLSFRLTDEGINSAYMNQLNEGIDLIQKEQYDRANDVFNLLMRIANQYAPIWYYSGRIKHSMGENYSAERFFNKAIEIYPQYLAPRKFILQIFENDQSYSQMLDNTNKAIETMDAWYFHYKRAQALYNLGKYNDAVNEITEKCLKKNAWDINQYFLLGDTYLALKEFEEAKKAYEKTLDINPFATDSKRFDDRMKVIYEEIEKANKNKKPGDKKEESISTSEETTDN